MADVITRLKVESSEYDSKIQRAAKGLLHMEEACRKVGGTLAVLEDDERKFVQSLGSMQTVATTTRGRMNELTQAYTELSIQYKRLTDEEKNGDFGKALSASLDQLKTRIQDSKSQLADINNELNGGGGLTGALDAVAGKFGINITQLASWGTALGAAKVALDVVKDAFFQSESNIDEWGRTVEGAKGAYNVFLDTINGGNWSNFFSNLSTAVQGARDLYDALDRLGSIKSNNQAAIAIVQQQIQQLRLAKRQGQNVDEQQKSATEQLAKLQQQSVNAGKVAGSKMSFETIRNYINANNTTGVNVNDDRLRFVVAALQRGGQNVFDKYKSEYEILGAKAQDSRLVSQTNGMGVNTSYTENYTNLQKLTEEEQRRYLIANAITERETEIAKGLQVYAQAVQEGASSAREQFKGNRYALQGTGGSGSKATPAEQAAAKFGQAQKDYQQALELAALQVKEGTTSELEASKKKLSAEESLWKAIGDAREVYDDPKYRAAQEQVASRVVELGGSVKQLTEQQEAAKKAARELEQAEKKQAQAQEKMAEVMNQASTAWKNNDLAGAYAAQSKAAKMGGSIEIPVGFTYTQANIDAFTQKLKADLAHVDVGSLDVNKIMGQLADAQALSNIMTYAMQEGIDMSDLSQVAQTLWDKIFKDHADILPEEFQKMLQEVSNKTGKSLQLDSSGNVKEQEKKETASGEFVKGLNTAASGLSNVSSGLKSLGLELTKEVDEVVNVLNGISSIITGVSQIISIFQVSAINANTAAIVANTIAQGAETAASIAGTGALAGAVGGAATGSLLGPVGIIGGAAAGLLAGALLFSGGGVVRAANGWSGLVPGTSYSGDNIPAFLNSGETVLSHAQVGRLESELMSGRNVGTPQQPYVTGETIWLGLRNFLEANGYGDIMTTRQ